MRLTPCHRFDQLDPEDGSEQRIKALEAALAASQKHASELGGGLAAANARVAALEEKLPLAIAESEKVLETAQAAKKAMQRCKEVITGLVEFAKARSKAGDEGQAQQQPDAEAAAAGAKSFQLNIDVFPEEPVVKHVEKLVAEVVAINNKMAEAVKKMTRAGEEAAAAEQQRKLKKGEKKRAPEPEKTELEGTPKKHKDDPGSGSGSGSGSTVSTADIYQY
eukprot:tig00000254_g22552.t1